MVLQLQDFRVLKTIGKGSYGECVLARLRTASLMHLASLKSANDSSNSSSETAVSKFVIKKIETRNLSARERKDTMTEVRVLSALQHPNIIHYAANFVDKRSHSLCIVMEYAAGGDLSDHLRARRKSGRGLFPEPKVMSWFVQICLGVKHCHDRKVLHRDLKPQNIFLSATGEIKIGDFGIAKVLNSTGELAKTAIGTPYYLSPEICQEKSYNHKSDVWSLGCILYEIATLKHAFDGRNMKLLVLKIVRGNHGQLPRQFSAEARKLVNDMLRRNPKARPSVNDMLQRRVLRERIGDLLSDAQRQDEFSHTVIHGQRLNSNNNAGEQKPWAAVDSILPVSGAAAVRNRNGGISGNAARRRRVGYGGGGDGGGNINSQRHVARISSAAAAGREQKQRHHEIFLIRQAKERMQAKRLEREKERNLKRIQQENMRKQARALLLKAKARHQGRRRREKSFGAARAAEAARGGAALGGAQIPVANMMPRNNAKEQSWEIQYMNQGKCAQVQVRDETTPKKKPPPASPGPGAGGAADHPSKLEQFNQQWAQRRDEIFKLAGIKLKASDGGKDDDDNDDDDDDDDDDDKEEGGSGGSGGDNQCNAISSPTHMNGKVARASPEAKGPPTPEVRKAKHEKGLAELRAMYLAKRRKRELPSKVRQVIASPRSGPTPPPASSPAPSPKSTAQAASPPPPPSRNQIMRPMLPPAPSPKQSFLAALRRRASEHVSETRSGKKKKMKKTQQSADAAAALDTKDDKKDEIAGAKMAASDGTDDMGARGNKLRARRGVNKLREVQRQRRDIQGKARSRLSRRVHNEKIRFRIASKKQAHANSIDVQKRLEEQRNARDAARKRMRQDIAKRAKHKKKPSQYAPVSVMVPSKFAGALEGAVARDDASVVFLNAPVSETISVEVPVQSSRKAQSNDAPVDIEFSFEDDSFGVQSDSDENDDDENDEGENDEDEGTMPFDLPSWPKRFGKDDTLRVPFNLSTGDDEPLVSPHVPESVLYL